MDYETFGEHQWEETGIFNFLNSLPHEVLKSKEYKFETASNIIKKLQPVAGINVPFPISWADEERDVTAWLGNDLQNEASEKLYKLKDKIEEIDDVKILQDWEYLQTSDHFYYMSTKWFSDGEVHAYFNPYKDPYEAFINYMNVLSDFASRVEKIIPDSEQDKEIQQLNKFIEKQNKEIKKLKERIKQYKKGKVKNI
jgi:alpha-amylase